VPGAHSQVTGLRCRSECTDSTVSQLSCALKRMSWLVQISSSSAVATGSLSTTIVVCTPSYHSTPCSSCIPELTCATPHPLISCNADPTRTTYRALGMTAELLATTPKDGYRRSYVCMGKFPKAARSVVVSVVALAAEWHRRTECPSMNLPARNKTP
jgi:hypothetical protein